MAKTVKLKTSRRAEQKQIDASVKHSRRATVGAESRVNARKARHALEARYIPIIKKTRKPSAKKKTGRRRTPPSK